MIRSMTGFASKSILITLPDESKSQLTINVKSLNSRYFEVSCRIPYPLNTLETDLIKFFKPLLLRGHIYCTIHVKDPSCFKGKIEPALETVKQYIQATQTITNECPIDGPITLESLLRFPNIFNIEEQPLDEQVKEELFHAIKEVASILIEHQKKEGDELKTDILKRVEVMQSEIKAVEKKSEQLIQTCKEKVHATLAELADDESRFAEIKKNALYMVLDKIDIHEEIVRFKSHLANIITQLNSPTIEKGKRLDFTLQELSREINTIAAKCSDATISTSAINIKVEIEKAREQAQNIV